MFEQLKFDFINYGLVYYEKEILKEILIFAFRTFISIVNISCHFSIDISLNVLGSTGKTRRRQKHNRMRLLFFKERRGEMVVDANVTSKLLLSHLNAYGVFHANHFSEVFTVFPVVKESEHYELRFNLYIW